MPSSLVLVQVVRARTVVETLRVDGCGMALPRLQVCATCNHRFERSPDLEPPLLLCEQCDHAVHLSCSGYVKIPSTCTPALRAATQPHHWRDPPTHSPAASGWGHSHDMLAQPVGFASGSGSGAATAGAACGASSSPPSSNPLASQGCATVPSIMSWRRWIAAALAVSESGTSSGMQVPVLTDRCSVLVPPLRRGNSENKRA